jgi:hypothetical protein
MEVSDGSLVVILDDFHEEMVMGPDTVNTSTNRLVKGKREMCCTIRNSITREERKIFNLTV